MEQRMTDLEIRLTHQAAAIEALDRAVVQQQQVIERLRERVERLTEQVRELTPSPVAPASEETPPPHY